jgi:hypothetical protein
MISSLLNKLQFFVKVFSDLLTNLTQILMNSYVSSADLVL